MKSSLNILFFIFISICSYGQKRIQDYHLQWDGISSVVQVKLQYTPTSKDSTVFEYGNLNFGGQMDIFEVVKNIRCELGEKLIINAKKRNITIYHSSRSSKVLFYQIDGAKSADKKPTIFTELFRPVITADFLCLVNDFFMLRRITAADSDEKISVIWDKFPEKFTYFNSINPSDNRPGKK